MNYPIIADAAFCVIIIGAGILGYSRGLYKTLGWIITTAASIICAAFIQRYLPEEISGIISSVVIFVILRILFSIIYSIIGTAFKLPLIKQTNGLAGAIIYICSALIILYILVSLAYHDFGSIIDNTVICRHMHDYNLWEMIMGISSAI